MDLDTLYVREIIDVILKIGAVAAVISLVLTIQNQLKKRSKFKIDFRGISSETNTRNNLEFRDIIFDGNVKNQSSEQNSITDIHYLIWANKARTRTLTNGFGSEVFNAGDQESTIPLPIIFQAKEGKHLIIKFSVCLTGTHVKELVEAQESVGESSRFIHAKYQFNLAFKDVGETLFDDKGKIKSQKLIDLWWTLPNTFKSRKTGNPLPYLRHLFRIFLAYMGWKFRLLFVVVGL
jgi:hypothetical protein